MKPSTLLTAELYYSCSEISLALRVEGKVIEFEGCI